MTLGNASSDDVTITGSLASSIPVKTTNSYNIGGSTTGIAALYFGNSGGSTTINIVSASSVSSSLTYTLPDVSSAADFVMTAGSQTITGSKTVSGNITMNTSGRIYLIDGTVGSPSLSFVNDTDTGVNLAGTNSLGIVTAGVRRAEFTASGYLLLSDSTTDSSNKSTRLLGRHYDTSTNTVAGIFILSDGTDNHVYLGGSSSSHYAATKIRFYTGATDTTATGTERFRVESDGGIYAYALLNASTANTVYYNTSSSELSYSSSSIRDKENVRPLALDSEKLYNLEAKTFERKTTGDTEVGYIAEELESVFPELVAYNTDDEPVGVWYQWLAPMLVEEIKKLRLRIEQLEAKV